MVFIHSRINDNTTVCLIQWLIYFKKQFFRLNSIEDFYYNLTYDIENMKMIWDVKTGDKVNSQNISSLYFNGGGFFSISEKVADHTLDSQINQYLSNEIKSILSSLFTRFKGKVFGFPSFLNIKYGKLITLRAAKNIGFNIPDSIIITSKEKLISLKKDWGRIITKGIDNGIDLQNYEVVINGQRTEEITVKIIKKMDNHFAPTLIQKLINKQFDVRTFFYNDKTYSIAIISQNHENTKVDWRNINPQLPCREIPFVLNKYTERKIKKLMSQLELNYGSIDFIYDNKNKLIFLEVNPYGQYGFVSSSGNYYIEREIAKFLN